jgi:hypothetical protein
LHGICGNQQRLGPYPIALHFIIVDNGRKMLQVVDANAVIAIGYRVI